MSSPPPVLYDAAATLALLPYPVLVDALAQAVVELADGTIRCPPRLVTPLHGDALLLSMPAVGPALAIHKLITVTPSNAARGVPTIRGQLTLIDPADGRTLALLDGPSVTGRRTAALSMLGLRTLGRAAPQGVLLIGTGVQAGHHVGALAALHPGVAVAVRGRSPEQGLAFCERWSKVHRDLHVEGRAAIEIDTVICCTTSREPVYAEPAGRERLLIATGSFQPDRAEIAADTVRASNVVVDDPAGAALEAGDLLRAGMDPAAWMPLSQVLREKVAFGQPVLLKTVGCAAWDLAAARVALAMLAASAAAGTT